ncbi:hypothetical protein niasHT_008203 [Heterodera trifolii]|uniref:Cilia- and flagella-associated protein 36 n=1 Tax=Heterodera trifolii TaxID=157864 RepID=A0ABD2LUP5_9BILA
MFSRRSSMTVKEEQIFDSFINFLRSELWQISINEFIEQRSIVFERDSNVGDVSTSDDTYHSLYGEYRKIVHDLLDAHCSDGGTTRDELMKTLKSIEQIKNLSQKEQLLLEPIVAAQDFDVFVPMMMRKNIELQLQALKMIEHLNGLLPSSLKLGQEEAEMWNSLTDEDDSERFIMISVLKQSRDEWEHAQQMQKEMLSQMEAAIRESLMDKSALEEMCRREQFLMEQALNKSAHSFSRLKLSNEEAEKLPGTSAQKLENAEKSVKFDKKANFIISPSPITSGTTPTATNLAQLKIVPNSVEKRRKSAADLPNENANDLKLREKSSINEENPEKSGIKEEKPEKSGIKEEKPEKSGIKEEKPPKMAEKRISLGQIHVPEQRKEMKNETPKGGDLAYRSLLKERDGISESQLSDRRQYLREQRDKLLKKKSQEREKQLIEAAKQINDSRPQTAKAARELMEQNSEVDEVRRRIAAKIKAEVINGK